MRKAREEQDRKLREAQEERRREVAEALRVQQEKHKRDQEKSAADLKAKNDQLQKQQSELEEKYRAEVAAAQAVAARKAREEREAAERKVKELAENKAGASQAQQVLFQATQTSSSLRMERRTPIAQLDNQWKTMTYLIQDALKHKVDEPGYHATIQAAYKELYQLESRAVRLVWYSDQRYCIQVKDSAMDGGEITLGFRSDTDACKPDLWIFREGRIKLWEAPHLCLSWDGGWDDQKKRPDEWKLKYSTVRYNPIRLRIVCDQPESAMNQKWLISTDKANKQIKLEAAHAQFSIHLGKNLFGATNTPHLYAQDASCEQAKWNVELDDDESMKSVSDKLQNLRKKEVDALLREILAEKLVQKGIMSMDDLKLLLDEMLGKKAQQLASAGEFRIALRTAEQAGLCRQNGRQIEAR